METLTLTLHKTKDTKNRVVYGTKDGGDSSRASTSRRTLWATSHRTRSRLSYPHSEHRGSLLGW